MNGKTGQLTNIVNNLDRNKDRVYEFDTLGRLQVAKGGGATGVSGVTANWTQSYGYDRYGNKLSVSASGITANNQATPTDGLASLSYDQNSNRITNVNYEYDSAGNQTKGQAPNGTFQRFDYDAAGRLVVVRDDAGNVLESYSYGASRQRLKTVSGSLTTYYTWGGSSVLCEYTETTGNSATFKFSKSYIYAGSRLLSTQMWNGSAETIEFHHPDRLGTKLVTNNVANTFYEQSTLPFGTSLDAEFIGTPTTNQRFTSYDRSQTASLDYAVNRSYSSGQGRFTTVDPIGMSSTSLGSPQSLNLYSYVGNNPIDFVDPNGLDDIVLPPEVVNISIGDNGPVVSNSGVTGVFGSGDGNQLLMEQIEVTEGGGGGLNELGGGGGIDEPSKECLNALAAMKKNREAYDNAMKLQDIFKSYGGLGKWLAAMAVRESNADPSAVQKGGGGRGLLQVDITQTPGKNFKNEDLSDAGRNIEISLAIMNAEADNLQRYGFEGASLWFMLIRNHNAGYFKKNGKVDRAKMREMAKNTNPKDFDVETAHGNYVSSISEVANHCFSSLSGG